MGYGKKRACARLMISSALGALSFGASAAWAQTTPITIPAQTLSAALHDFGSQTGRPIMFSPSATATKMTGGVSGVTDQQLALTQLLQGTGLAYRSEGDAFVIVRADDPQSGSAAGDGAEVEALIVTAQKREEDIQDVPIAISAFTQRDLEAQKIEGGFDLLKVVPNVTFSKSNFSSYNFSIRGIGTKAISATTDPGVAVSFNNVALIQNRLFEQEYFDIERIEVLRGPQGTLYGRNATAGVINVISAKPRMSTFEASIKGEVGSYSTRRAVGMINVPLIDDKLAVRLAGSLTKREGYDYNERTMNRVNGRDLWSGRITVGFNPTDNIRTSFIYERFKEDDDRSRTSKQLCHRDPGPTHIDGFDLRQGVDDPTFGGAFDNYRMSLFSQGCKAGSLYDPAAFGTPNGLSQPIMVAFQVSGSLIAPHLASNGEGETLIGTGDPYGGLDQSRDLRTIASVRDPVYRAQADLFELNLEFDLPHDLTLISQTAYDEDSVYSFQDFNRFNTVPIFRDTADWAPGPPFYYFLDYSRLAPGGVFCDPQIGCSDSIAAMDISSAKSRQLTQELRLQSDLDGPVNFSLGANYTRFNVLADYYVFNNMFTLLAALPLFNFSFPDSLIDPAARQFPCNNIGFFFTGAPGPVDYTDPDAACPYIDPNPIESIDGEGHNYFRSKNPYKLKSSAVFGELYWELRDDLKLTAGLRYTDDRKSFVPVPSQILLARGSIAGGAFNKGYAEKDPIKQRWTEWTGRLGLDWKPDLSFTDDTLLYGFYSRGYKGGGANPPSPGFAVEADYIEQAASMTAGFLADIWLAGGNLPILQLNSVEYGETFEPEFVNAFEIGAKNTLLQGALTFNTGAFYYDYKGYQVSQIRDRTAVNENFDAEVWGVEFQATFAPSRDLKMIANLGYLDTKIGEGMSSIDLMNRTQSDPAYTLVKPWFQLPSNCVIPTPVAKEWAQTNPYMVNYYSMCGGLIGGILGPSPVYDPTLQKPFDFADYPELNGGAGIKDDLAGNELPNSPHWTTNIGAEYGRDILDGTWRVTLRGDAYWQAQSWARVYNAVNDKLHGWYNANVSVKLSNEDLGLDAEFYVKNLLDKSPITDAFINSDDTSLTTNVFVLDPRLVGVSLRKTF